MYEFINNHFIWLTEYGTRLTIRSMTEQLTYMITGGMSCEEVTNNDAYKYLFSNLFFGYIGTKLNARALNIIAIAAANKCMYDHKRLRSDEKLLVGKEYKDMFGNAIKEIITDAEKNNAFIGGWTEFLRRTYLFTNIITDDVVISQDYEDVFSKQFKRYLVLRDGIDTPSKTDANLGKYLRERTFPENLKWILDAYINSFNIIGDLSVVEAEKEIESCIVPAWHPATLEKINDQKIFFLDGCGEWWNEAQEKEKITEKEISDTLSDLLQMSMLQSTLDLFPSYGQVYFGTIASYGAFSLYGRNDIKNENRLRDMIHKDAIFDDDFDKNEVSRLNDNAKMIYGVMLDYAKAFPNSADNLSIVFIDPSELQPIVAAIYKYIDARRKNNISAKVDISLRILVKPENKGGRNYLAYWMDEFFSQDENVNIHTYLNEWNSKSQLEKLLNGNNDIAFVMDILKVNNLGFVASHSNESLAPSQCRFPIVYKPTPISSTSVKRTIELSQPQFKAAYEHTQIVRYRNNMEKIPDEMYIASKEVSIDSDGQAIVHFLHEKAYWVVCVDSGMDGALLRSDDVHQQDYNIIGFSTGKGAYGQYNLTITTRKTILETIRKKLEDRLYSLFKWDKEQIKKAAQLCIDEASGLDGISLLSAINPKDENIREFLAYILTSLREEKSYSDSVLKIVIHLDSYKHWFDGDIDKDDDSSASRPDFLVLETFFTDDEKLKLKATVTECKTSIYANAEQHKNHALEQVKHGVRRLSKIFNPNSKSIKRRYWYAQLYRALAFAQVTFSNNTYIGRYDASDKYYISSNLETVFANLIQRKDKIAFEENIIAWQKNNENLWKNIFEKLNRWLVTKGMWRDYTLFRKQE